jgi:hypothetical protein
VLVVVLALLILPPAPIGTGVKDHVESSGEARARSDMDAGGMDAGAEPPTSSGCTIGRSSSSAALAPLAALLVLCRRRQVR